MTLQRSICFLALAGFLAAAGFSHGDEPKRGDASPGKTPVEAGGEDGHLLCRQLLSQIPPETAVEGWLKQRDGEGTRREATATFQVIRHPGGGWETRYQSGLEILVVSSTPSGERLITRATGGGTPKVVSGSEWFQTFAGTDFCIADLALEFLRWPEQKIVSKELRRGRACQVLESSGVAAEGAAYVRVRSWVDNETGGIIHADAFDAGGRQVKEFALRSFKKVNGQWQLREMEMINLGTDSRTRWEFDLTVPVEEGAGP